MNYQLHSFRHAEIILQEKSFLPQYYELSKIVESISDEDIIERHESFGVDNIEKLPKSISRAINELLKERFIDSGWLPEPPIFQNPDYSGEKWRLDFAKDDISVEVGFNHSGTVAWNMIKPILASELNHVEKAIQTRIGVIITATNEMREYGGFDGAIGTYENYLSYLDPLQNVLTVPLLIIGLTPPETFRIIHKQIAPRKKVGLVERY